MKTTTKFIVLIFAFFIAFSGTFAQVSINSDGNLPDASAMLEVKSLNKGFLPPRMSQAQRNSIGNPATGLTIYQTDGIPGLYYNWGTPLAPAWALVGNNAGQWLNNGNNIYYNPGLVGIGTSNPLERLHVDGRFYLSNSFDYPFLFFDLKIDWPDGHCGLAFKYDHFNKAYIYYDNGDNLLRLNADNSGGFRNDMVITSAGSIGIGTPTPSATLHVAENSPGYTGLFGTSVGSWTSSTNVNIGDDTGPSILYIGQDQSHKGFLYWQNNSIPENAYYHIGAYNGSNPLVLQADAATGGKVGVGTTSPQALFHVANTAFNYTGLFGTPVSSYNSGTNVSIGDNSAVSLLYIGQSESNKGFAIWRYRDTPASASFEIGTYGGNNPLILQAAGGNVGIGTDAPVSLLDVGYDADSKCYLGYSDVFPGYFYHNEMASNYSGQAAVYGYRTRSEANDGTGYGIYTSNTAMKGFCFWGDLYSFGTSGFNFNDNARCGGILGAQYSGSYWGSLGYKNSGGTTYGGYFTSYTTGGGKSTQANAGIGLGAWGDLLGADIHGKVYGIYAEGEDYAMYSNGPVYRNNLDVHLQPDETGSNTVLYTNVSTDVTVQTCGYATLTDGSANIAFDPAFAASLSSEAPVVVTVTPTGNSNGVFLSGVSKSGFTVVENNAGKSNVTISYIAIGKRAGYEHPKLPKDITDKGYPIKMARGLHNDADTHTNGEGLYYENGRLIVGIHPSALPDPDKPAAATMLPKPGQPQKKGPVNRSSSTGIGEPDMVQRAPSPSKSPSVADPSGGEPQKIQPVVKPKSDAENNSVTPASRRPVSKGSDK